MNSNERKTEVLSVLNDISNSLLGDTFYNKVIGTHNVISKDVQLRGI